MACRGMLPHFTAVLACRVRQATFGRRSTYRLRHALNLQNLRRHANHYSFLGVLGPAALTAVAERLGAGVYFNTLVSWKPQQVTHGMTARGFESVAVKCAPPPSAPRD